MRQNKRALKADYRSGSGRILVHSGVNEPGGEGLGCLDEPRKTLPAASDDRMADESAWKEPFLVLATISRFLQVERPTLGALLGQVADLLSAAFGHPERIAIRVAFDGQEATTSDFERGRSRLSSGFITVAGKEGTIELVDLEFASQPENRVIGVQRALLEAVAEMLTAHFDREAEDQARPLGSRITPPADHREHVGHGCPD